MDSEAAKQLCHSLITSDLKQAVIDLLTQAGLWEERLSAQGKKVRDVTRDLQKPKSHQLPHAQFVRGDFDFKQMTDLTFLQSEAFANEWASVYNAM